MMDCSSSMVNGVPGKPIRPNGQASNQACAFGAASQATHVGSDTPVPMMGSIDGWVEAAKNGSREAQGQLMLVCQQYLFFLLNRWVHSTLPPQISMRDLVQETFTKSIVSFEDFRGTTLAELRAWLRRILFNHLNSIRNVPHFVLEMVEILSDDELPPLDKLVQQEEQQAIRAILRRLPEQDQQIIRWREEGRNWEEVGRGLGCTADAARVRHRRLLQRLAKAPEFTL